MKQLLFLISFSLSILFVHCQKRQISDYETDSIRTKLETLFKQDQLFRRLYPEAEKQFGKDSLLMDYFWQVVEVQDKRIEAEFIKIVENYGWLGISKVGRLANTAQFSIIQHSSIETKNRFATIFKESVIHKESQPIHYARFIDRMLVNEGKPQKYGTQITRDKEGKPLFFELENPEFVDQRRKAIGLGSIKEFAESKGIKWVKVQRE